MRESERVRVRERGEQASEVENENHAWGAMKETHLLNASNCVHVELLERALKLLIIASSRSVNDLLLAASSALIAYKWVV